MWRQCSRTIALDLFPRGVVEHRVAAGEVALAGKRQAGDLTDLERFPVGQAMRVGKSRRRCEGKRRGTWAKRKPDLHPKSQPNPDCSGTSDCGDMTVYQPEPAIRTSK